MSQVQDQMMARAERVHRTEDGSLSNKRVERYCLMRAEEVIAPTAAWTVCMAGGAKTKLPSNTYKKKILALQCVKDRIEELMAEKQELQAQGVWGQLEWQCKQNYRRACANDDARLMHAATEMLYKLASRAEKPAAPPPAAEGDEPAVKRGPGAPPVQIPREDDAGQTYFAERLLQR